MTATNWRDATLDLRETYRRSYLAVTLASQDVAQRYRRSRIGAFWLTINMGVMIGCVGIVFGMLFRTPMQEFLPFLGAGVIIWGFMSSCISEGCTAFSSAEGIILQVRMPLSTHILRVLLKNFIIFGHNILIFPLILITVGGSVDWRILWIIPGFVILAANLFWMMVVVGVICARFRDMTQIVQNIMQVAFYVTPIMWMPKTLPDTAPKWILELNPFYHLLGLVREPLHGTLPSLVTWVVTLVLLVFGGAFTLVFFGRYRSRVAYWL